MELVNPTRLLVIDDEPNLVASIRRLFCDENIMIIEANDGKEGLRKVMSEDPHVIVVDYKMPGMNGLEFLKAVQTIRDDVPVIVTTAHGDKSTAILFLNEGAFRYLEKPIRPDEFKLVVQDAVSHYALLQENVALKQISSLEKQFPEIVGNSRPILDLFALIEKISGTDISVLIRGESGTGKELIANAIHEKSSRARKPFIRFNCAALPETLIESELFGYEKGAFTGAEGQKLGRFELAHGGTIFLDEIGELNPAMQVKLLRVLQEKEFERVGGTTTVKADVRIIAATNQPLEAMMHDKQFREDLFYRLNAFPIFVSPLRERGDDVLLLAMHFLGQYSREYNRKIYGFTESAKRQLKSYTWKGNVRELQNVISRAVILCDNSEISERHLGVQLSDHDFDLASFWDARATEDDVARRYAIEVYKRCNYNKKEACEWLKINYRTLMNRLEGHL
jgi:DNA-binding NtrC family response regulator